VDTWPTSTLIDIVANHRIDVSPMITHRFSLDEFEDAYRMFSRPADTGALKVVLTNNR
jgi:alcohol dehydrogenase